MSRPKTIINPRKLTLSIPDETIKKGKRMAKKAKVSLSRLVTNFLEEVCYK